VIIFIILKHGMAFSIIIIIIVISKVIISAFICIAVFALNLHF